MQAQRLVNTAELPREDWLAIRRRGIGGSDMAAIAGMDPWKSPMAVYLEKLNEIPEEPDNERMYWGRVLEDVIANEFKARNNLRVQRVNAVLQHPKHPVLLANIDRLVLDRPRAVLEIKTTSAYNAKEWEDDKLPDRVMVQLQHYLGVTGLQKGYVAALIGGNRYIQYEVPRDDQVIDYLQRIALDFWKLVENRTPPEMDGSKACSDVLELLYPKSTPGTEILLPDEALELIEMFEAAQAEEKAAKERKEEAANKIKALLGDCEAGRVGDRVVTWKTVVSTRLDSKKLKAEHPGIYEQYANVSEYRRFLVK